MTEQQPISSSDARFPAASAFGTTVFPAVVAGPVVDGHVPVDLGAREPVLAEAAVRLPQADCRGYRCLLARGADGEHYLIGLLGADATAAAPPTTADGSHAVRVSRSGSDCLEIRDPEGRTLVSHDPVRGLTRVLSVPGDLELAAPAGTVRVSGGHGVELSGPTVRITGEDGRFDLRRIRLAARDATLVSDRARITARRIDLAVEVSIQKVRDLYRTVSGLFQSRANRSKILVDKSYEVQAERAYLRAEEEVRVLGRKIHLG